jgi:hypothetical protein
MISNPDDMTILEKTNEVVKCLQAMIDQAREEQWTSVHLSYTANGEISGGYGALATTHLLGSMFVNCVDLACRARATESPDISSLLTAMANREAAK